MRVRSDWLERLGDLDGASPCDLLTQLEATHASGYALRVGGFAKRTIGLAVALRVDARPLVCLSIMFMHAAISPAQVVERYSTVLLDIAKDIEASPAGLVAA